MRLILLLALLIALGCQPDSEPATNAEEVRLVGRVGYLHPRGLQLEHSSGTTDLLVGDYTEFVNIETNDGVATWELGALYLVIGSPKYPQAAPGEMLIAPEGGTSWAIEASYVELMPQDPAEVKRKEAALFEKEVSQTLSNIKRIEAAMEKLSTEQDSEEKAAKLEKLQFAMADYRAHLEETNLALRGIYSEIETLEQNSVSSD